MNLFETYKRWMETGTMGDPYYYGGGLCNTLPYKYGCDLGLFMPDDDEKKSMDEPTFWAYDGSPTDEWEEKGYTFTPLRQTIVLFICAMNNEI